MQHNSNSIIISRKIFEIRVTGQKYTNYSKYLVAKFQMLFKVLSTVENIQIFPKGNLFSQECFGYSSFLPIVVRELIFTC